MTVSVRSGSQRPNSAFGHKRHAIAAQGLFIRAGARVFLDYGYYDDLLAKRTHGLAGKDKGRPGSIRVRRLRFMKAPRVLRAKLEHAGGLGRAATVGAVQAGSAVPQAR